MFTCLLNLTCHLRVGVILSTSERISLFLMSKLQFKIIFWNKVCRWAIIKSILYVFRCVCKIFCTIKYVYKIASIENVIWVDSVKIKIWNLELILIIFLLKYLFWVNKMLCSMAHSTCVKRSILQDNLQDYKCRKRNCTIGFTVFLVSKV